MKKRMGSVKVKVFVGYLSLVVLASLIIWIIFTEILLYSKGKVDFNPSTNKFIHVNTILTNLYQAEGLERSYIQTGQISPDYLELMKTISLQIDTLVLMIDNQTQQIQTYNIKSLLQVKQRNLKELFAIKNTNSSNVNYQQDLREIPSVKGSGDYHSKVYTKEGDALEMRQNLKEQEVLASDRSITFQLRQMLSYLEKEELIISFQKIKDQQIRIRKATALILLIGSLALISIIIFLVNILKDISKSQHYRQDLEKAKAYSESLLKSKEQFMLSLTHDLKSPLNSIIGFSGFMEEDEDLSLRLRKYAQNISSSSKHILKLVNDLADLARLKTGKLAIDRIPFDLKILIDDIVESFSPQAQAKNIDLQLNFNQSPTEVYMGDPARITQIFSNLISNAINFTESGNVTIKVSILQLKNTDQIQVEVIDTGIGIAEENIQLVFEEFNRVRTTNKQYEGTGLGLTITKKIVDLLQGKISLKSTPGKGSQFTVVLPLEKGEQLLDIAYRMSKIRSQGVPGDISGTKIWLIDDDPLLLEMTSIILKSAGGEVHSFNEPKRAISSFTKGCADLLITDIQMPEMDGIELLNQIQKKNGEKITAIAISGKIPLQNEYDGFSAFIQKPFQAHTLINVISGQRKGIIKSEIRTNSENTVSKGYNLDQLLAFVEGDQESLNQILVSFIHSGNQNLKLFRQYIEEENISAISELSHKMLSLFRQIEVNELVELLVVLERNDYPQMSKEHFCSIGKSAVEKIETLLQTITKVEKLKMD